MIRDRKAHRPDQPFFLYFAHPAAHAPLHAKAVDIESYRGVYDDGWDEIRAQRHARQIELGIVSEGTKLAPRNSEPGHDVVPWDDLSQQAKDVVCPGLVCRALRLLGLAHGQAFGIAHLGLLSDRCRRRLRLEFPLPLGCCSGDGG